MKTGWGIFIPEITSQSDGMVIPLFASPGRNVVVEKLKVFDDRWGKSILIPIKPFKHPGPDSEFLAD